MLSRWLAATNRGLLRKPLTTRGPDVSCFLVDDPGLVQCEVVKRKRQFWSKRRQKGNQSMRDYSKWAAGKAHPAKTSKANPKGHLVGISFDLGSKMTFGKRDRVYVIFKNQAGRFVGRFLIGKRRRAPWTGASFQETGDDNEG